MEKGGLVPFRHIWELYTPLPKQKKWEKYRLFILRQISIMFETSGQKRLQSKNEACRKHALISFAVKILQQKGANKSVK